MQLQLMLMNKIIPVTARSKDTGIAYPLSVVVVVRKCIVSVGFWLSRTVGLKFNILKLIIKLLWSDADLASTEQQYGGERILL